MRKKLIERLHQFLYYHYRGEGSGWVLKEIGTTIQDT